MTDAEVCLSRSVCGPTTWLLVTEWHTGGPRTAASATAAAANTSSATWEESGGSGTQPLEPAAVPAAGETATGFTVTATDCTCVWRGTADADHVARHLVPDGLDAGDYLRRTRRALTSGSRDACGVTVAPDRAQATLWWRLPLCDDDDNNKGNSIDNNSDNVDEGEWSLDAAEDAAQRMCLSGSLVLARVPLPGRGGPEALLHVLDLLGARVAALGTQTRALQRTAAQRGDECAHMAAALAQLAADKARLERDMYARFCAVLNEKKRRIRELTALLARPQDAHPSGSERDSTPTPPLAGNDSDDDLSDVVFAPDDSDSVSAPQPEPLPQPPSPPVTAAAEAVPASLDLLGLRQPSGDLSPAPVPHRRHRVAHAPSPPSSPARPRPPTPQRKRRRSSRTDADTVLDTDALFDNLD